MALWTKYGPLVVAALGAIFAVVRQVAVDGFTDQEVIMIGLAIAQAFAVWGVPQFKGTLGGVAKTVAAVAIAALGFLVDAVLGGIDQGELWQLAELVLVSLGVPLSLAFGARPPVYVTAGSLPGSGNAARDAAVHKL